MNSMSRNHFDDDCDPCEKERKQKKVGPTIIKCGTPGAVNLSTGTATGNTFQVTTLALNTTHICDPCVKLEFASNLVASATFTGTVNFQINKICRNQLTAMTIGPVWTFTIPAPTNAAYASTFSFFVCDCDSCFDECCTYTVVATFVGTTLVAGQTLAIQNALLGAVVASGVTCNC